MDDYFFISTPLHFMIAANIALQHAHDNTTLVIMTRDATAADHFHAAAGKHPAIFQRVVALPHDTTASRHTDTPRFRAIEALLSDDDAPRIFTGNDRRIEFQYAMHIAARCAGHPHGIYMDEGAVTYFGHKSMHGFAHRYLDPLAKRLFIGRWYRPGLTTGASDWVDTIYAAFPQHVYPLLKRKTLVKIDPAPFNLPPFKALAADMLPNGARYGEMLRGIKLVITLPHEAAYIHAPQPYEVVGRSLLTHFASEQVAVKPHPRTTNHQILEQLFPGAIMLEPTIGMEALLPLLADDCLVAGDISSTLLTTKWLRPSLPLVALMVYDTAPQRMTTLYKALQIPMMTPDDLQAGTRLTALTTNNTFISHS